MNNCEKDRISLSSFFFLFFASTGYADAATYYVSTGGNNSNTGTSSSPWRTLQKAANTMVAGDAVIVYAGTYSENVSQSRSGGGESTRITYQGNPGDIVIVQHFTISGNYITVDGFRIEAQDNDGITGYGVYVTGTHVNVKNCYITECPWGAAIFKSSSSYGWYYNNKCYHNGQNGGDFGGTNHLIENNEVWRNVQYHPKGGPTGGPDADGFRFYGSGHTFRGNYIHEPALPSDPGNSSPHIDCFQTWDDSGSGGAGQNITFEKNICKHYVQNMYTFMLEGSSSRHVMNITIKNNLFFVGWGLSSYNSYGENIYVYNNTFVGNWAFQSNSPSPWDLAGVTNYQIINNICVDYARVGDFENCTGTHDHTSAWNSNGSTPNGPQPTHKIWGQNPQFVNFLPGPMVGGDYHLTPGSPCKDAGISIVGVTDDYDGISRPQMSGYDIGAYEYTTSAISAPVNLRIIP